MTIIDQLIEIYHNHEYWHRWKLSEDESSDYFVRMLAQGNIVVFMDGDTLAGYVEFYRITPEQWRRIMNDEPFYAFDENITDGDICYINAIFIHEEYRDTECMKYLKEMFFNLNSHCRYFVGIDNRHNKRIREKGVRNG